MRDIENLSQKMHQKVDNERLQNFQAEIRHEMTNSLS